MHILSSLSSALIHHLLDVDDEVLAEEFELQVLGVEEESLDDDDAAEENDSNSESEETLLSTIFSFFSKTP